MHGGLAAQLSFVWLIPFAGMLLSIAFLPVFASHFWHSNRNQLLVALGWATPVLGLLLWKSMDPHVGEEALHALEHAIEEYASFIVLLGSLYLIAGGIVLTGDIQARPSVNTAFLAVGALLANFIGTTGASMLLIRPMLRTNSERKNTRHIPLFFIFIVSNIGGALTPIGDPPLFLGYLRGVPFFWTLEHVGPIWWLPILLLLGLFYATDRYFYGRETAPDVLRDETQIEPLRITGGHNFALLGGVVLAVLFLSSVGYYVRELAMVGLAATSWFTTSAEAKAKNGFSFGPILEVAALFVGIFVTMVPATMLLQAHGAEFGVTEPWQYFWASGMLSSFLDNAPTYVTFAAMACGGIEACTGADQLQTLVADPRGAELLLAISLGSVFMGANSYIGNGPNFMVKAIAEENGYAMPSFFGYVGYAMLVLGPIYALVTFLWLL
jgi:Na+/H+ antiporter NhaD/arsenite permease-like protein